ncbi:YfiT family bacillithiol transferase [Brevibacillus dissolubilis]|uniref:YfiT family bacillithiol transferase n=1 Tax=Brevibacillus dissolubilis TaxID=1844116 RepID=UPI0011175B9B|nr:bacillithiol transferase BstA [Brevibacillus dissolubilis]
MNDLRFPIGPFRYEGPAAPEQIQEWIQTIQDTPAKLRQAVAGLTDDQLDTPYRPEGWTVRQVVHHMADSHMNSFIRFKLTLTEETPTIRPYEEARWAELGDSRETPIEMSLALLDALHQRWTILLTSLTEEQFQREFRHPEHNALFDLKKALALYAWHSEHHIAHITTLKEREGWK